MKEKIELVGSVEVAKDVEKRVETVGVRGLNLEQARELGVFQRIGHLLSLVHAGILASYSVYGHVDYLVDGLHAKKNEIAREMNVFDKSFERFIRFWTSYYKNDSKEAENRERASQSQRMLSKSSSETTRMTYAYSVRLFSIQRLSVPTRNGECSSMSRK